MMLNSNELESLSWNEMIVTPDLYFNSPRMNIGVQYDPRHSIFPNMDHHPWMSSPTPQTSPAPVIKEEPRDDAEYGQSSQDSALPLTPPPYQGYPPANAYRAATPPKDTPPASTPSPREKGEGSSNSEGEYYESGESLKRLQMALHRNGMIAEEKLQCPVCEFSCSVRSQFNEHLMSHETKCSMCDFTGETSEKLREHMRTVHDCDDDSSWGDEELNTPKVNSQGKVKTFRCKQCEFSAVTKLEFWEHSRTHIKQERLLTCPKCPFVTEYKHHLEYHLRNHFGSKPFKCDKCSYSCVNKSMLNSHLKSHSNIYQFRCADCTYATKYCHSLKLHLRKYAHSPAMVLNPDGSPNPLPIVDVYGTRRGPKQKPKQDQQSLQPQVANIFNPYSLLPTQMPYYNILNGFGGFPFPQDLNLVERNNNVEKAEVKEDKAPLDLSCPEPTVEDSCPEVPPRKRRKGKAFKLDTIALRLQQQVEMEELPEPTPPQHTPPLQQPTSPPLQPTFTPPQSTLTPPQPISPPPQPTFTPQQPIFTPPQSTLTSPQPSLTPPPELPQATSTPSPQLPQATPTPSPQLPQPTATPPLEVAGPSSKSPKIESCEADSEQKPEKEEVKIYTCDFCDISFKDIVMYTMHMGYHGYDNPYKCNMCGQHSTDKLSFFLHIARISHS